MALAAPNIVPPIAKTRKLLENPTGVEGCNDPNSVIIIIENEEIMSIKETSSKVHKPATYEKVIFDLVYSK